MFVDTREDLIAYKQYVAGKVVKVIPLLASNKQHYKFSDIISYYVSCDQNEYVFPFKHPESVFSEYTLEDILDNTICYFYGRSILLYKDINLSNVYDLELAHYLNKIEPIESSTILTEHFYARMHTKYAKTNTLVSISNFIAYARDVVNNSINQDACGLPFYTKMQTILHSIERSGLKIDQKHFTPIYGSSGNTIDGFVYTKYNLFTSTGRPSNRFGGINFAALNKNDDTRRCFVSRYDDGTLVEMDFKAYHPHIIASLIDYDFGDENVYEHLAKYYFETNKPSKDQVSKAKEYTFNQVYGGINKKYLSIEFFAKAQQFATNMWTTFQNQGWVESGVSGRRFYADCMEDMTEAKLFNYYIQMTETELNSIFLKNLLSSIDSTKALPVLYIYDAVVFDCKKEYVNKLIEKILGTTTQKYPISVKIGDNYKEMIDYNYEATTIMHIHGQQ